MEYRKHRSWLAKK